MEPSGPGLLFAEFFVVAVFFYEFNFTSSDQCVQIAYFFLIQSPKIMFVEICSFFSRFWCITMVDFFISLIIGCYFSSFIYLSPLFFLSEPG